MATVPSYCKKYLRMKPEVNQLFDEIEEYHDWVRLQYPAIAFDPAEVGKYSSPNWQKFLRSKKKKGHNK